MTFLNKLNTKYRNWKNGNGLNPQFFLQNRGHCPTCNCDVTFIARNAWLRDHYVCVNCGSIPRERALMSVIEMYYPDWKNLMVHESSPEPRGASIRLAKECVAYTSSQYFIDSAPGEVVKGVRCENFENLTFADESVDLHISQDVMEHVYHPSRVFREVARTLKPGGSHIFTVPIVNKNLPTKLRACIGINGEVTHLEKPIYHGNPISDQGALVTIDWGFDICQFIFEASGLFTQIIYIDDLSRGIRAEYIEVLITHKPK